MGHQMRNEKRLIGRRPAHSKNLRVQGGDRAARSFCQEFSCHFVNVFTSQIAISILAVCCSFDAECLKLSQTIKRRDEIASKQNEKLPFIYGRL